MSSNLPISSPYRSTPDAPVSDTEREQLSSRLNTAYEGGLLGPDDFQTRLDALFAAQKMGQLLPVVEGLPALQTYDSPAMVASTGGQPGQLSEARSGNRFTLLAVGGVVGVVILIVILLLVLI